MKKFLIKISVVSIFVILLIFVSLKIYHYVIIHNVYHAIENFKNEKNRYYSVTIKQNGELFCKEEIFCINEQMKYLKINDNSGNLYFEIKNFSTNQQIAWRIKNGEKSNKIEENIEDNRFITNIPISILQTYRNNKFNFKQFFQIYYIIPTKYEDKKCYKIVTKTEVILVDKNTYLPVYVCRNLKNSDKASNANKEFIYEFKINTVTDKDMEEP